MGSKVSKGKRPTFKKTKAFLISGIPQDAVPIPPRNTVSVPLQDFVSSIPQVNIPIIPHDIVNEIVDHLASNLDLRSLQACALVSRSWARPCQRHLFHTTLITPANASKWLKLFPAQEQSPAHHVRNLRLRIGRVARIPEEFFECISWFTEVDEMSFSGYGGVPLGYGQFSSLWEPACWKLPRSVTSLTIGTDVVTLVQVRDIMAQLPNLDDLELSGPLAPVDRRKLPGIGTVLNSSFCGRLTLLRGTSVSEDVINMLLETPSGLRFAELEIHCTQDPLPSSVIRLAEACGKTLVKLSHSVGFRYTIRDDAFDRSFDFSNFPNIQEVTFGFQWADRNGRGLPWIAIALSTLRPSTSPHLSAIKLDFCTSATLLVETMIAEMGNDLRRIADEVARIEREFEGAVSFIVCRDSKLWAVLDTLNILQHHIH